MLARGDSLGISSPSGRLAAVVPGLGARGKSARKRRRSRVSRRRGARPPRRDRPGKPALGRRLAPAPGARRRRRQRRAAPAAPRTRRRLRDAFHLTRPGADPGPAGRRLLAWRELSARSVGHWRSSFHAAAEALGVPHDEALQEAIDAAEACAGGDRPAPFAAAQVFALARRALTPSAGRPSLGGRGGEGELLAAWLADVRAGAAAEMAVRAPLARRGIVLGRRTPRGGGDPADGAEGAIVFAYAKAAARACDLSAELGRRAQKLLAAAPKLRAKGAPAALEALLDDDSLSASSKIGGQISERGGATAVRPAGRARRDPRTDRTRDVPALRALSMARTRRPTGELDTELEDLPAPARWREWMGRVEAAIFASAEPVSAREPGARRRQGLQPRAHHRRHPRRIARPSL